MNFLTKLVSTKAPVAPPQEYDQLIPTLTLDQLPNYVTSLSEGYQQTYYDGGKYDGGFGPTELQQMDYWALRQRSEQLFNENLYASGIIKRLITNEINTGLTPEATPESDVLGIDDQVLKDWSDNVETRFSLWANSAELCDYQEQNDFAAIQRRIRRESLVVGDCLVVVRFSRKTRLPCLETISGNLVQTPLGGNHNLRKGHTIVDGVELDAKGSQVAYWVLQNDLSYRRLAAFGEKSKRRLSWLVYGNELRVNQVRGVPLLSTVLLSLKEIDRYRDSTQRKALINSFLAMFVKRDPSANGIGTLPFTNGAIRKEDKTVTSSDGKTQSRKITNSFGQGMIMEELQAGEDIVMKGGDGTDLSFSSFEETIMKAVAWSLEIPLEILTLAFSNNYSASQAAINEFRMYLFLMWARHGAEICTPVYKQWLLNEVLSQRIQADNFLQSWRNNDYYTFNAWCSVEWYGSIKPSTDMAKQVKASRELIEQGLSTRAKEARITTGSKYSKNVKRLVGENEELARANAPLVEQQTRAKTRDLPQAVAQEVTEQMLENTEA